MPGRILVHGSRSAFSNNNISCVIFLHLKAHRRLFQWCSSAERSLLGTVHDLTIHPSLVFISWLISLLPMNPFSEFIVWCHQCQTQTLTVHIPHYQNQYWLLVTRQNDNHSPGPGGLIPISHQRSKLSKLYHRRLQQRRVWKCISIPNGRGWGRGGGLHL